MPWPLLRIISSIKVLKGFWANDFFPGFDFRLLAPPYPSLAFPALPLLFPALPLLFKLTPNLLWKEGQIGQLVSWKILSINSAHFSNFLLKRLGKWFVLLTLFEKRKDKEEATVIKLSSTIGWPFQKGISCKEPPVWGSQYANRSQTIHWVAQLNYLIEKNSLGQES